MCAERLSPQSSFNRGSSMALSPESARILNPQSQVNVTGVDPLPTTALVAYRPQAVPLSAAEACPGLVN
jgi:hypothetical protein